MVYFQSQNRKISTSKWNKNLNKTKSLYKNVQMKPDANNLFNDTVQVSLDVSWKRSENNEGKLKVAKILREFI